MLNRLANQPESRSTVEPGAPRETSLLISVMGQFWENARHVKNERIWFTNTYAIIVAATLSFLHSTNGDRLLELSILAFLVILSVIGLLISLRLKVELEGWLRRVESLSRQAGLSSEAVYTDVVPGAMGWVKFRWLFPVFYGVSTAGTLALLIHTAAVGR